jgi:hypothetical protein
VTVRSNRGTVALATAALGLLVAALLLLGAAPAHAQARHIAGIVPDVPTGAADIATGSHLHARMATAQGRLPYGGGRVLHSNRTHVIFWEPVGSGLAYDPGYESLVETFLTDVAADSHKTTNVYSLSGQYTDRTGRAAYDSDYGGSVVATDALPANGCTEPAMTGPGWTVCLTDAQLEIEIEHVIAQNNLPTTSHDIYFLVTPNGFGSCTDAGSASCALGGSVSGYCGYHSETDSGALYAIIPYNAVPNHCQSNNPRPNSSTADPSISTLSHEQNETITDPDGDAWIDSRGNEEADICLTNFGRSLSTAGGALSNAWNESINGGHFFLQEEWSNANGACEARAKPDLLSFDSIGLPGAGRVVSFTAHGAAPQGRIVSFEWFFGDGRAGFGRHPSHSFKTPGTYRVVLRSTDSWGNWAFARSTVRVKAG